MQERRKTGGRRKETEREKRLSDEAVEKLGAAPETP